MIDALWCGASLLYNRVLFLLRPCEVKHLSQRLPEENNLAFSPLAPLNTILMVNLVIDHEWIPINAIIDFFINVSRSGFMVSFSGPKIRRVLVMI